MILEVGLLRLSAVMMMRLYHTLKVRISEIRRKIFHLQLNLLLAADVEQNRIFNQNSS